MGKEKGDIARTVHFPADLYQDLRDISVKEVRSIQSLVIFILRDYVERSKSTKRMKDTQEENRTPILAVA